MTSSIGGEHALAYGEWVTVVNGGVCQMTGEFSSVGGPFEFDVEGLPEYTFFGGLETIPYAKIEASPAVVEVPWEGGTVEGLVQFAQKDERVSYGPIVASDPIVSLSEGRFTVDGDAFLRAGAKPLTVQFSGDQTYEGQTHTERASVQIRPAPTSLSFQPGVLTVSPAGASGPAVGVGEHGALRYELIAGSASGLVSIEGLNVSAGPGLTALVEDLLREGGKPPEPFDVQVGWKAYYDGGVSGWGVEVASGTATLKVRVEVSSKVKAEAEAGSCCDCAEGTETKVDAGCVSLRQAFGRTPLLAGMPVGALAIEEEVFDEALFTPAALRYDHPMMRRLDPETRLVTTPMGWTIAYGADGFPT